MDNKNVNVEKIIEICKGKLISGDKNKIINSYCNDTRKIEKDDLYIAIKGENIDGNKFVEEAFNKGAIGALVDGKIDQNIIEKYKEKIIIKVENSITAIQEIAKYKRSLYNIPVIAITGSVGKTSTKDIIANVVSQEYKVLKTEGNFNNHIGLPLTLLKLKDHTAIVIEMGMNHFGEIRVLTNIAKPTACVITNIGTAHIGILGSRENILKSKLEILEGMDPNGPIFINNDNDILNNWVKNNKDKNIYTYAIENKSTYIATNINQEEDKSVFETNNNKININVGGIHFVYNAMCAYAVGKYLNIKEENIIKGIETFELTKNRMDIETINNNIKIINDSYNASYDSMKAALEVLGKTQAKRKIAVLGNMLELGEFTKELHEKVGQEVVKNKIDLLITVGEYAENIAKEAIKMGMKEVCILNNIEEAEKYLNDNIKEDDAILLKASNSMKFSKIAEYLKSGRKI